MSEEKTNARAIEYLAHYKNVKYGLMPEWVWDMAIKALEQEPCDCISRQAVLDMVEDMTDQFGANHRVVTEGMISMLPPVTPKADVLDKIRAEIIELRSRQNVGVLECLEIIDKYKAESEG